MGNSSSAYILVVCGAVIIVFKCPALVGLVEPPCCLSTTSGGRSVWFDFERWTHSHVVPSIEELVPSAVRAPTGTLALGVANMANGTGHLCDFVVMDLHIFTLF